MPSTKISDLTAMTTAAAGDLLVAVDIADTTMAPTGTDKRITAGELLTSGLPAEFSTFDGPGGSGLVGFGGLTSGEPALKRNGTELQVRLADDSGATAMRASQFTSSTGRFQADNYVVLTNAYGEVVFYNNSFYPQSSINGLYLGTPSGGILGIYFGTGNASSPGTHYTSLIPQAAALELRNSTNAQTLRVYGTYTDPSNHVRASLGATSTAVTLAAETAGTGADNVDINAVTAGTGSFNVKIGGTAKATFTASAITLGSDYLVGNGAGYWRFSDGDGYIYYSLGGQPYLRFGADVIKQSANGAFAWASSNASLGATDLAISRNAAGIAEINNGTAGQYRDLALRTLLLRSTAAPGSPVNGDVWRDSTQQTVSYRAAGVNQTVNGVLFTQTDTVTVADTVTETDLTGTGVGTLTLPANFFVAGKTIKIRALGYHSSTASPDITLRFKLGSTTVLTTGTISSGNATDESWICDACLTCRTTGATGTVIGQGYYDELHGNGSTGGMVNTAATTIDTTASQAISLTVEWGTANAGNTISCTNLVIEILN